MTVIDAEQPHLQSWPLFASNTQCCMDWTLPFTEIASLSFPNAYKTTHPASTSEEVNKSSTDRREQERQESSGPNPAFSMATPGGPHRQEALSTLKANIESLVGRYCAKWPNQQPSDILRLLGVGCSSQAAANRLPPRGGSHITCRLYMAFSLAAPFAEHKERAHDIKEHPPPLKLRLFGSPGYKLKLHLNHPALKSCKSTAAAKDHLAIKHLLLIFLN